MFQFFHFLICTLTFETPSTALWNLLFWKYFPYVSHISLPGFSTHPPFHDASTQPPHGALIKPELILETLWAQGHFALLWNLHTWPHLLRTSWTPVASQFLPRGKCLSVTPLNWENLRWLNCHLYVLVLFVHQDNSVCVSWCVTSLETGNLNWRLHWLRQPRPPRLYRLTTLACACRRC